MKFIDGFYISKNQVLESLTVILNPNNRKKIEIQ
jgi:hypothetical protein